MVFQRHVAAIGIALGLTACTGLGAKHGAPGMAAHFERFSYEGRSQERATPDTTQYRNPILSGYYPDPSVLRVGDDYYLINSSFTNFPGLPLFHSRDLVNWTRIANVISRPSQFSFKGLRSSRGIYSQVVFRSASVRGPFMPYEHNPILSQRKLDPARPNPVTSTGHAKFVQIQDGTWWATFPATRPYGGGLYNIGRETFLLPVT